ncbi:MAG: CaiB/BaiF CoA transferase family protein [Candidatus Binatia bacterium]
MGPLEGIKVIEIAGIGPGPFCAMMLADMGADVIRVDRKSAATRETNLDALCRGRRSIAVDLKKREAVEAVLKLLERADALIEGFRPGVMERLGLGPDVCLARNPKLVYGRMTGWGQYGTLAHAAGHDINYIALSGALHATGRAGEPPAPPMNLIGDFGGGGMLLAFGLVCGILEARRSAKGQVIDAAMTDGSALLSAQIHGFRAMGFWSDERGANLLDGGAHFYDSYETADGKWVSIGSIEPQFYAELVERAGLTDPDFASQMDRERWPVAKKKLAAIIKTKTRDEWSKIMEGTDVCFAPVLSFPEAYEHPHNRERRTFVDIGGVRQPAPAPRFSRTPPEIPSPPRPAGADNDRALADWGFSRQEIDELRSAGAI